MIEIRDDVQDAISQGGAVVALETAVLTHGLPHPENLSAMAQMAKAVRAQGALPAVAGVLRGRPTVGLTEEEWPLLLEDPWKCSARDIPVAVAQRRSGGTTVAATAFLAHRAGVRAFATGGIGGVHRGFSQHLDISADLGMLAQLPLVVVSAGAKSVLDLGATLEVLESLSIPIVGYRTNAFPGFYVEDSGHTLDRVVESPLQAARVRRAMDELGMRQALLCVQPGPRPVDPRLVEEAVEEASLELSRLGVRGKDVTPFLIGRLNERHADVLMASNIALLVENARLAAEIAVQLAR